MDLKNSLLINRYTHITHEDEVKLNSPHHFVVKNSSNGTTVAAVNFQEGPVRENGINGLTNEDIIAMVICRLQGFQASKYACRENALALTKLEEAMLWLRKRTNEREFRGIEGTSTV